MSHKNADLEKAEGSSKKLKPFKPALLELTADELNYSLCLFVKEVCGGIMFTFIVMFPYSF